MQPPPDPKYLGEMRLGPGEQYRPPDGIPIFKPFHGLAEFWPDDQPERTDWILNHEQRLIAPLGRQVADVFGVRLATDLDYAQQPEDFKATSLFCVMTRAGLREAHPGIYAWSPICVVARYCVMAEIRCQLDPANGYLWVMDMLVWSRQDKRYVPVMDEKEGWIKNPGVVVEVLRRYGAIEGLI